MNVTITEKDKRFNIKYLSNAAVSFSVCINSKDEKDIYTKGFWVNVYNPSGDAEGTLSGFLTTSVYNGKESLKMIVQNDNSGEGMQKARQAAKPKAKTTARKILDDEIPF